MPGNRNKEEKTPPNKPIHQYEHKDKDRLNIPPVGLVDAHTDGVVPVTKKYEYDPHLDPQLVWAGKAEHTSFEVSTVSLHVHERIDPRRIIEMVQKEPEPDHQLSMFEEQHLPLRQAIEFYKHRENWSNRLIAGDSLLVMNSLLEKEGMGGKVQMVYFDPPYGIKYGSNFQPFVNKRDVKDGKDEDLTAEPEMIKAFRDTWELGIHSYLTYLRDRLLLARELLHESGSIFVQISDENIHHVRELMDEVFGTSNFVSIISFSTTSGFFSKTLSRAGDYIVWYAKDYPKIKFRQLFKQKIQGEEGATKYKPVKNFSSIPKNWWPSEKLVSVDSLTSQGPTESDSEFEFNDRTFSPPKGMHWKTTIKGIQSLILNKRIVIEGNSPRFLRFLDDFPVYPINNLWTDIGGVQNRVEGKIYVVQTSTNAIERCTLMSTDPGDLVLDITCGSGTTAYVAEQWGRRWITCDTSRVAITLAKQRLITASFDYYELAYPKEGVGSGFKYKTVPHITLKSIANNEPAPEETLYDLPFVDRKKLRVTGPFTMEAVPSPVARSLSDFDQNSFTVESGSGAEIARTGETLRLNEWRDELLKSGVRAKGGSMISFTSVELLSGTRYLQAKAETREDIPKRVVVCFGPEHAPLEQRLVELALEEARSLVPRPEIVLFCAFQFDEEAAKDIDETNWPGLTLLKAQMNADLQTDDLKKKRSSNESFWLIGQPEVVMKPAGEYGKFVVEVLGFDYYNPRTGSVESGGKNDIAMWMLDTDYDGRSLFPSQVFFPMAGVKEGWSSLARNLKAEIDEERIEAFGGTVSLPFTPGKAVAVKIIDARGIESLKIIRN
jgi:adenine-specific DNA-methyltransferase